MQYVQGQLVYWQGKVGTVKRHQSHDFSVNMSASWRLSAMKMGQKNYSVHKTCRCHKPITYVNTLLLIFPIHQESFVKKFSFPLNVLPSNWGVSCVLLLVLFPFTSGTCSWCPRLCQKQGFTDLVAHSCRASKLLSLVTYCNGMLYMFRYFFANIRRTISFQIVLPLFFRIKVPSKLVRHYIQRMWI